MKYPYIITLTSFVVLATLDANPFSTESIMSISTTAPICDVNRLYTENYQYSLPQTVLEGFLSGKAFDYPKTYTKEELEKLESDISDLYQMIWGANPTKEKVAIITAGPRELGRQSSSDKIGKKTKKMGKTTPTYALMMFA